MAQATETYYDRDFWAKENLRYVEPHFRLEKSARIVRKVASGRECDLLDVGCGPATLMRLVGPNIRYHGIDIAVQRPASNLRELDFVENPIRFGDKRFDIIVAQGVFEYIGRCQAQKFAEIRDILHEGGTFIVTYVNFDHRNRNIYWPYNNIQGFAEFRSSLQQFFRIERYFPTSHRWQHDEPRGRIMRALQQPVNFNIPLLSRWLAVEYFFICRKKS